MRKDEYKILIEEIRAIKNQVNDIDDGLTKDRERIQDLTVRLGNVENEIKETRQAINRSSEITKNKVADVVDPIIESTDNLTAQIKKSKTIIFGKEKGWVQKLVEKR
jgi:predicted  nucleic acid-binding Zn-ribbon protein